MLVLNSNNNKRWLNYNYVDNNWNNNNWALVAGYSLFSPSPWAREFSYGRSSYLRHPPIMRPTSSSGFDKWM